MVSSSAIMMTMFSRNAISRPKSIIPVLCCKNRNIFDRVQKDQVFLGLFFYLCQQDFQFLSLHPTIFLVFLSFMPKVSNHQNLRFDDWVLFDTLQKHLQQQVLFALVRNEQQSLCGNVLNRPCFCAILGKNLRRSV